MPDFLRGLFATDAFHPHGYCYLWQPGLIGLHVVSDSLIGFAYIAIGMTLAVFVRRGSGDIPFSRIFVAFGVFIAACGATHFMEIWTLWSPVYWLSGSVKVVTAAASVLTALVLPPLVPVALETIRSARVSERRKEELERTNAELARLNERLKEADEAKTRFFANVSHELRTPLTLILGPTERLLAEDAAPGHRGTLESVKRNAELLLRHVNDLLDVQKVGAGEMPMHYARTDLAEATRLWAAHFESAAAERGIRFDVATPPALSAEVDTEKVARVVFNVLGNAFKFTPDGGTIRFLLTPSGTSDATTASDAVHLEVHDSGPGIRPEDRERVFEPFRQADDSATRRFGGTGLGLAIVRDFVQMHGGTVSIGDSPAGGALVRVDLPVRAPADVRVEPSADPAADHVLGRVSPIDFREPNASSHEAGGGPDDAADPSLPLVLVVEDNPEMNRFVRDSLRPLCRVVSAADGQSGLELARQLQPDVVVSDIMMPELSGDALVEEIRRLPELDATPILLLSARADDALRLRLLAGGAQDYLIKPFSVDELRARVGNWATTKRAGDVLRRELNSTKADISALADEVAERSRERETALAAANLALAEAQEANRVKADFLSVMSHELRTPLNAIMGYTDLLEVDREANLSETQRARLGRIKWNSDHLLRLVEEVLTYARAEAGRERVEIEPFDLGGLIRESTSLFAEQAARKGIVLDVEVPDHAVPIRSDPQKVRQIALNLVGNAVKFTDEGHVSVLLESRADGAVLHVLDTGPGIAAEHVEKVFEPFFQVDATKTRRVGGTGLGLAIVRQLAELLGGSVGLRSAPERGSHFTLVLPHVHEGTEAEPPDP